MARYNKEADLRRQQAHSFNERDRMIKKHYGSWMIYEHKQMLADRGEGPSPKSPEQYLREENPHSGF